MAGAGGSCAGAPRGLEQSGGSGGADPTEGRTVPGWVRGGCTQHIPGGQQAVLGRCGSGSVRVRGAGTQGRWTHSVDFRGQAPGSAVGALVWSLGQSVLCASLRARSLSDPCVAGSARCRRQVEVVLLPVQVQQRLRPRSCLDAPLFADRTLSLDTGRAEEGGRGVVSQLGCAGGVRASWLTHFTQPHLL